MAVENFLSYLGLNIRSLADEGELYVGVQFRASFELRFTFCISGCYCCRNFFRLHQQVPIVRAVYRYFPRVGDLNPLDLVEGLCICANLKKKQETLKILEVQVGFQLCLY